MSSSLFRLGQVLKGRLGKYIITKKIQDTVWFAKNEAEQTVVIKGVKGHRRVENERNVLERFQHRTPYLRPLVDEVEDPSMVVIVLSFLDDDLLHASITKTLNGKEIKYVARRILEALVVLHEEGYVHTDVKLDNVFVNYREGAGDGDNRFSDVQLGDFGGTYPADSSWATEGRFVGSPMWSSPEMLLETPWNTATDIWSYGAVVISLIYGGDFNLFRPHTVPYGHEEYGLEVLKHQFRSFGPFPPKYDEIARQETVAVIIHLMDEIAQWQMTPFCRTTEREVGREDKEFIGRIMMIDWRDRLTAKELLADKWFTEEGEDEKSTQWIRSTEH
ncbi:MAG: hypothetical protein M1826_005164 [Phylliscum demangeonii]|nr:MAG: hypothetical protein M1826_005164 [Phylliscum demangeonii]